MDWCTHVVEIDDILMLNVGGEAFCVVSGKAGGMLREFMSPEVSIGVALVDPECVHVIKEIIATKGLDECVDAWA